MAKSDMIFPLAAVGATAAAPFMFPSLLGPTAASVGSIGAASSAGQLASGGFGPTVLGSLFGGGAAGLASNPLTKLGGSMLLGQLGQQPQGPMMGAPPAVPPPRAPMMMEGGLADAIVREGPVPTSTQPNTMPYGIPREVLEAALAQQRLF